MTSFILYFSCIPEIVRFPIINYQQDGDVVRPLADGSAPEPPEGFTIVVKDNGLMVLRKKRYRDLRKVGIGGFLAKTRTPKGANKKGKTLSFQFC